MLEPKPRSQLKRIAGQVAALILKARNGIELTSIRRPEPQVMIEREVVPRRVESRIRARVPVLAVGVFIRQSQLMRLGRLPRRLIPE